MPTLAKYTCSVCGQLVGRGHRHVALDLPTGNTNHDSPASPPTEFCVFGKGTNPSEKGDFLFDGAAAKAVMDHAKRWGNRFPFDWCHKMVRMDGPDPAEDGKAAGWFTPELRDGALWATAITWTPLARQKIGDREFVYFSPAFNVDDEERVVELTNVALTNLPAMHGIEQLVAADTREHAAAPTTVQTIIVSKKRAKSVAEAKTIAKKFAKGNPGAVDETSTSYRFRQRDPSEFVAGSLRTIQPAEGVSLVIGHLKSAKAKDRAMTKDELKGAIHAKHEKLHGEMYDEEMRSKMDAKLDEMKMDELKAYDEKLAKHVGEPDGDEPHEEPDGDEPEEKKDSKKADDKKADEKKDKADGDGDEPPAKEHSKGASDAVLLERIAALEAKITKGEQRATASTRQALLEKGVAEGKLSPADAQGKGDRGTFLATLSNEQLEKYLRTASKLVSTEGTKPGEGANANGERTYSIELEKGRAPVSVTLSKEEIEIAAKMGNDPAAVARQKAKRLDQQRARTN